MKEEVAKGKTPAIVSHITLVGCFIAITMNLEPKNAFARFYIRQTFGIHILFHALAIFFNFTNIPYAWAVLYLLFFGIWMHSLFGALNNRKIEVPLIGSFFQKWFTFIS